MIGQNLKDNQDKQPNSREMEKLKRDFPQFFSKDGEFKLDMFKDFLGEEEVDISKEGYELKFLGKSYAKYISSLETETYISPDCNHNENVENKDSENIYIVGDNLDALKHMLGSYSGKIKCIYIDPPYNTGSDGFVYPDNFQFSAGDLSEKIGITEEEAERILELAGKSTHSAWLTFMYPRLLLARDLLSDDGVIFISIDYNEQANLKLMCDEVFGEENLLGLISVVNNLKGRSDDEFFATSNEYLFCYSKNKKLAKIEGLETDDDYKKEFKYEDNISKYKEVGLKKTGKESLREDRPDMFYPIYYNEKTKYISLERSNDKDIEIIPIIKGEEGRWRWGKETFLEKKDTELVIKKNNKKVWSVYVKMRDIVDGEHRTVKPKTTWINPKFDSGNGTSQVENLLSVNNSFDNPKPIDFLKEIVHISGMQNSIVLDFFSGSSTTADAVMQLNAEDGGSRKYIMVQLPEKIEENKPAYKAGYKTIDEIGRARIEKAAQKIKKETGADIDYGYKLYYLERPSEKTLMDLENFVPENKLMTDDMVSVFDNKHSKGKESILATWLSEDGYGLSKSSKSYKLKNYVADLIEKTLYIIDEGLKQEDSMELIRRIENEELDITRLVVYVHSVPFNVLHELRKNLKVLRNNKNVTLIERF